MKKNKDVFTVFIVPIATIGGFLLYVVIRYEYECFSFLFIAVLFSAGNAKKNEVTVFIDPIVTIGGIRVILMLMNKVM